MLESVGNAVITATSLELSFGGIKALDDLSFAIHEGKIVSIIGPNGAGKTCLINCVTGYYRPQKGQIIFKNRDISGLKPHVIAQLGMSRTFQDPTVFPGMTALEILMAARHMHTRTTIPEAMAYFGRSRSEDIASRKLVEEVISLAHIEELRKTPVAVMSYGQRKQVEIARVLVMQPQVVLLDEPMSGLDDYMKEIVTELILKMYHQGMTVVLIEHDMQVVMELSHSIIVMDHGQKIAEGTPAEILRNKSVAEAYLGGLPAGLLTTSH